MKTVIAIFVVAIGAMTISGYADAQIFGNRTSSGVTCHTYGNVTHCR